MRLVRVRFDGDVRYGLADDESVTLISDEPFAAWEPDGTIALADAKMLAPVVATKVVCVGLNYRSHAEELGMPIPAEPVIFLKPPTAVIGPHTEIAVPAGIGRVDYEAELAVVIGRRAHRVSVAEAARCILGYTCANDVTARDLQRADGQWTRAKGFDTFCPMGPWVDTDVDPVDLGIVCRVNGIVRQRGRTADMIFSPPELLSFVSHVMSMLPGDVLLTGTPVGVGPLAPGDEVEVSIEGIGTLENRVVENGL